MHLFPELSSMLYRSALNGLKVAIVWFASLIPTRISVVELGDLPQIIVVSLWYSHFDLVVLKPNEVTIPLF
jgi:hypothetical protein